MPNVINRIVQFRDDNKFIFLQIENITFFLISFFSLSIGYIVLGYERFINENINTVLSYEMVLFNQVNERLDEFFIITAVLVFLINILYFIQIKKVKPVKGKYFIFYLINLLFVILGALKIIAIILSRTILSPRMLG